MLAAGAECGLNAFSFPAARMVFYRKYAASGVENTGFRTYSKSIGCVDNDFRILSEPLYIFLRFRILFPAVRRIFFTLRGLVAGGRFCGSEAYFDRDSAEAYSSVREAPVPLADSQTGYKIFFTIK